MLVLRPQKKLKDEKISVHIKYDNLVFYRGKRKCTGKMKSFFFAFKSINLKLWFCKYGRSEFVLDVYFFNLSPMTASFYLALILKNACLVVFFFHIETQFNFVILIGFSFHCALCDLRRDAFYFEMETYLCICIDAIKKIWN